MFALPGILSQLTNTTPPVSYPSIILDDTPRFYYKLTEPVGSTQILDYSGNNFHATPGSAIQYKQPTIVANAGIGSVYLPSTGNDPLSTQIITVPWQLTTSQNFSVEAWIKIDSTKSGDTNRALFGLDTGSPNRVYLEFTLTGLNNATAELNFVMDSSSSLVRFFPLVTWNSTTVYHIVLVMSRNTAANRRLHINNTQYNLNITFGSSRTTAMDRLLTSASQSDRPTWYIGRGYEPSTRNYGGFVSHFAVYDYALTAAQVDFHYINGLLI